MTEKEAIVNEIVQVAAARGRQLTHAQVEAILDEYNSLAKRIAQDHIDAHYLWELPGVCVFFTVKNMDSKHVRDKTRKRSAIKKIFKQTFNEVWESLQNPAKK